MMVTFAIIANVIIALAYAAIGLYIAPRFKFVVVGRKALLGARLARLAGMAFFATCAGTHLEMAYHASQAGTGPNGIAVGEWFTDWHGLTIHIVQGVAGWAFTFLAIRYLRVNIYNRDYYEEALEQRIDEIEEVVNRPLHEDKGDI